MRSKMAYFSDIDLATLDRSRLNERIEYKLSLFNRPNHTANPVYKTPNKHTSNGGSCYRNHQQVVDNRKNYASKLLATNKKTSLQQHSTSAAATAIESSTTIISNQNHSDQNNNNNGSNGSNGSIGSMSSYCNKVIKTKQMARNSNDNNLNRTLNKKTTATNIDVHKPNTPSFMQRSIKQSNGNYGSLITTMDRECVNDERCIADVTEQRSFANELSVPHRKRSGTWP